MKIYLDDLRPCPEGYTPCLTVEAAIELLFFAKEPIEEISFDHDLGEDQRIGYDLVCFIEGRVANNSYPFDGHRSLPRLVIHSANPVGRKNMEAGIAAIQRIAKARVDRNPEDRLLSGDWEKTEPQSPRGIDDELFEDLEEQQLPV